jgi:hypothetical protein
MPDTTDYMLMGYAIALVILAVTVGSIWWRYQIARRDEALLERLEQEEAPPSQTPQSFNKVADELVR